MDDYPNYIEEVGIVGGIYTVLDCLHWDGAEKTSTGKPKVIDMGIDPGDRVFYLGRGVFLHMASQVKFFVYPETYQAFEKHFSLVYGTEPDTENNNK